MKNEAKQISEMFARMIREAIEQAFKAGLDVRRAQEPKRVLPKVYKRDMRCRAPRCFRRSKGPRFHFLCEKHLKRSKR